MFTSTQSTLMCDVVPFVEWSGELLYAARLSMIACGMLKGTRLGVLDKDFATKGRKKQRPVKKGDALSGEFGKHR